MVVVFALAPAAHAATITVDRTDDTPDGSPGDLGCTLREAVQSANTNANGAHCVGDAAGSDTILLEGGKTYTLTRRGAPEAQNVSGDLDIIGGGVTTIRSVGPGLATIDANSAAVPGNDAERDRAIEVDQSAGGAILERVRIINGAATNGTGGGGIFTRSPLTLTDSEVSASSVGVFGATSGFGGGGILVTAPRGALTMTGSTVANNTVKGSAMIAAAGGGITFDATNGEFAATNSTITGNQVDSSGNRAAGAGIMMDRGQGMTLTNVTVTGNTALGGGDVRGGGISINNPKTAIRGSILSGNQAPTDPDCGELFPTDNLVSLGGNVLGGVSGCGTTAAANDQTGVANPGLGVLSDYGGPTRSMLPNPGSPAIDRGGTCPATDQRSFLREPVAPCDAGAVEAGAAPPQTPPGGQGNDISFGKPIRNKNRGTALLPVAVPGAGALDLAGKGLKPVTETAAAAGELTLKVKAAGKAKKKLRRKGKKTFEPSVTFTPAGGTANTESTSLKLVRK